MYQKEEIYEFLKQKGIVFEKIEHAAVFTIAEVEALGIDREGKIAKNLFLRDAKGKRHFLVTIPEEKSVDLKSLAQKLDSSKLSFASEERLMKYLGLTKGSVTPLGVLNDEACEVEVIFDASLQHMPRFGVHPNDNTASVFLAVDDLEQIIRAHGNAFSYLEL